MCFLYQGDIKPHNILLRRKHTVDTSASPAPVNSADEPSDLPHLQSTVNDDDRGAEGEDTILSLPLDAFELKISDMGLSRDHQDEGEGGVSSCSYSYYGTGSSSVRAGGTIGWGAPELYNRARSSPAAATADGSTDRQETGSAQGKDLFAMDVFSLGCVFYFVMIPGECLR